MPELLLAFAAGLVVATLTTPVGISGAVFLLPVQMQVLQIPSPQVTPTNLLYNVVSAPGALVRFLRRDGFAGSFGLTGRLLAGTIPGVLLGATVRVFAAPGDDVARLLAVCLLAPIGVSLIRPPRRRESGPVSNWVTTHLVIAAFVVGFVGGIYGIGGGSILSPLLVAGGLTVGLVAPAALACTWITSVVGALAFAVLANFSTGAVAPAWGIGIACGLGGLLGGYIGAVFQPRFPERVLRIALGVAALAISALYVVQFLT